MSSANHIANRRPGWPGTCTIAAVALLLSIPVAIAALQYEKFEMPTFVLGQKDVKAGLDGKTKTVSFAPLSGANDAVTAAACISIICSLLFVSGLVTVRHVSERRVFGWLMLGSAAVSVLGNAACMAYVFIVKGKYKDAAGKDDIVFDEKRGVYEITEEGRLFTREAWACSLNSLYGEREGRWADNACKKMKTGRILTVPMVITAILLVTIALWQVQRCGGLSWLLGKRRDTRIADMRLRNNKDAEETEHFDLRDRHYDPHRGLPRAGL